MNSKFAGIKAWMSSSEWNSTEDNLSYFGDKNTVVQMLQIFRIKCFVLKECNRMPRVNLQKKILKFLLKYQ